MRKKFRSIVVIILVLVLLVFSGWGNGSSEPVTQEDPTNPNTSQASVESEKQTQPESEEDDLLGSILSACNSTDDWVYYSEFPILPTFDSFFSELYELNLSSTDSYGYAIEDLHILTERPDRLMELYAFYIHTIVDAAEEMPGVLVGTDEELFGQRVNDSAISNVVVYEDTVAVLSLTDYNIIVMFKKWN